ncbi:MAG: IS21 family transposase [Dehalococcoidia bacterium]|nr:IS21 family transposase [Dehalococcoidia bacterium]
MAQERLSMRKIKEILRLKYYCGLSHRQIAHGCKVARSTVSEYLWRAEQAGIGWAEAEPMQERELEERLFSEISTPSSSSRPLPDFDYIHKEIKRHRKLNLTLDLLWREYKEQYPEGYQYSQFCDLYRRWRQKLDYSMRQDHRGGEKLFVDYAEGLSLRDPKTGDLIPTQIFVAVWGASNYTYVEASLSQELPSWIGSHVNAFDYFGCVPEVVVPDCLKSGVRRACLYEPDINPTYADLARHYGLAVLPARPRRPKDKAKVETGVLIAKRWILAVLRHRTFYSLTEMNRAIGQLLERLNSRPLRKLNKSRRELFETFDRPQARSLAQKPYEYAEWYKATVNIDYHIEVGKHYYSIPFRLLRETIHVRLTAHTLEAFHKGERVAAHTRSYVPYGHTTLKEHMPPAHQKYLDWSPSRMIEWAAKTGPCTARLVETIMAARAHPEQGYRSCLGVLRLDKHYPQQRIEAAARRALKYNACSLKSLRAILTSGLDRLETDQDTESSAAMTHENIRGGPYYH